MGQVTLIIRFERQRIERKADRPLHAELAQNRQAWRAVLAHAGAIALVARDIGKPQQIQSLAHAIADRAVELQTLLEQGCGAHELTLFA
ncbi:MAG TPA: hypothetical protein VKE41_21405 [Roseiflexaceae bacterium]|nr:hypothetical protein [Roseiflexaceae bacterium]